MFRAWTNPWDIEEWLNAAALMNVAWIAHHGTSGLEQRWRKKRANLSPIYTMN